jgi:hypothetical protein
MDIVINENKEALKKLANQDWFFNLFSLFLFYVKHHFL